jgi:hypothetical protein
MDDTRYVYGLGCLWHDSIDKVGKTGNFAMYKGMPHPDTPCCPHCGSILFEAVSAEAFYESARLLEVAGHPGYLAYVTWSRGKCYDDQATAAAAYFRETGIHYPPR